MIASPTLSADKWAAIAATASAGLLTGSLLFVSVVDARSFITHVKNKKMDVIQRHFPIWWPYGRDYMLPTLICGIATNCYAYTKTSHTNFAVAAAFIGLLPPYTVFLMSEDIEALRKSSTTQVGEIATRFCNLHHFRVLFAGVAFFLSLVAVAEI